MKSILCSSIAATCLVFATGFATAQDATKSGTKMEAKKDMSMQDCKDHMNTMKGQKRSDPATAETTAKCDTMMKNGDKMGTGKMKPSTDSTTPAMPK